MTNQTEKKENDNSKTPKSQPEPKPIVNIPDVGNKRAILGDKQE